MGLDIKPVIITALFDIGRDKWDNYTQSYGGYLYWMERTLAIQTPMVVFTEEQFVDKIKELREKYYDKTEYVITTKEELDVSKIFYNDITSLMNSDEFKSKIHHDVPEMNQPWYNIIMYNKMWWLKQAKEIMQGTHYIWTDAGCYREDIERVNKPFPSLKIGNKPIFFSHHPFVSIYNVNEHVMSQMRFIQGGSFIIPKDKIDELTDRAENIIRKQINEGYIGSDEKIFDIMYLDIPDEIELIQCGWREYFEVMS